MRYCFYFLCGLSFVFLLNWCLQKTWIIEEIDEVTFDIIRKVPRLDIQIFSYCYVISLLMTSFKIHCLFTLFNFFYFYSTRYYPIDVKQAFICCLSGSILGYYIACWYYVSISMESKEEDERRRMSNRS